jgi:hypothetical protein
MSRFDADVAKVRAEDGTRQARRLKYGTDRKAESAGSKTQIRFAGAIRDLSNALGCVLNVAL